MRKPRRIFPRVLLALATVGVTLLVAELVARLALGERFIYGAHRGRPQRIVGEFDADLGWRNRPSTRSWIVAEGFDYDVSINGQGWRGPERDPVKQDGTYRIVLLGDSVAWGWGVDDEECFAHLVDEALGTSVEVLNLAVPGFSTDQQFLMLEREGRRLAPDLVLLCCVLNDVQGNTRPKIYGMEKPCFVRSDDDWLLENRPVTPPTSALDAKLRFFGRRLRTRSALFTALQREDQPERRQDVMTPEELAAFRAARAERAPGLVTEACESFSDPASVTFMLLGRIRDLSRELNAELLVFDVPHQHDEFLYRPGAQAPESPAEGPFTTYLTQCIADAGTALGFDTLAVDQVLLDATRKGENLDCGDGHLNERGNELVAEVLVEALRKRIGR